MAKKRIKKSRKKSYLKRASRRKDRRTYRRKDKRKIKKTRKKRLRGGAHLPEGEGQVETLEEEPSIMRRQQPEPEPVASLSRLSSSRTVNVDDELLSDPNIGVINGHGKVDGKFFVIPDGICLWVITSAGSVVAAIEADKLEEIDPKYLEQNPDFISSKYRKYEPGSLIQEQTLETLYSQGFSFHLSENPALDKIETKDMVMCSYGPSFILTGKNRSNIKNNDIKITSETAGAEVVYTDFLPIYGIPMETQNRSKIEEIAFSEHDERIMDKSELLNEDDDTLIIETIKLSELFKKISVAQKTYAGSPNPIPTNWVGNFCRSGTALNIDFLKKLCSQVPSVPEFEDSDFGGDITYRQEGESQLTHQSSLSSRRVPGNFKQIVEELYMLCNDTPDRVNTPETQYIDHLKSIKTKIDNIETLTILDVCIVFSLRKLNL